MNICIVECVLEPLTEMEAINDGAVRADSVPPPHRILTLWARFATKCEGVTTRPCVLRVSATCTAFRYILASSCHTVCAGLVARSSRILPCWACNAPNAFSSTSRLRIIRVRGTAAAFGPKSPISNSACRTGLVAHTSRVGPIRTRCTTFTPDRPT